MTILSELLKEIKSDDNLEQIRILCDKISLEEKEKQKFLDKHPKGPNLFLVLEVPGRIDNEIGFLGLERESSDLYLAVFYTTKKSEIEKENPVMIKQRAWNIKDHRPEKILTSYAKQYKILIGE